ncbi:MAG: AMP-binding protein, partial [Acidimicrobiales bacterium]
LPLRLASLEEFASQTRRLLARADARLTLVAPDLAGLVESGPDDPPLVALDTLGRFLGPDRPGTSGGSDGSGYERRAGAFLHNGADRRAVDFVAPPPDRGRTAIVQYTSGSTADPKGVVLPHAQVVANVDAIVAGIGLVAGEDTVVSWLPLYHDMGLIGMLAVPMAAGLDLVLAAPQDFMASPSRWLEWMSDFRGTCTAGPNFAYALATRAMARMEGLDLSSWRLALNGAEPIDPAAVEAFCAAGERHGLDPRAVFCAFGMAEAVLAVTFPDPGSGLSTDTVDRRALERERAAIPAAPGDPGARRLARLGQPVGDLEIRIVDPADPDPGNCAPRLRGEREVGELQVRGSSVTPGYYADPEATAAAFTADGWLRTGDLAYLAEGELVVCGRSKDVIIVGGRNVFPEDVERAVGGVPGVRAGNVIAFGVEGRNGREGVVVVAETREVDPSPLRQAVAEAVRSSVGVPARDIVLVDPGSLPKTSSGKLQRSLCRQRYLGSELQPVPGGDRSGQDPGRHGDANPAQT